MTEKVYAGIVDDLVKLVANCQFPAEAFFLAERLPQHVAMNAEERENLLRFTHFDANIPFATYTSGRIFHRDFELRWEKVDDKTIQAVYVGIERSIQPLKDKHDLGLKKSEKPKYYYLFGKRLQKDELGLIGNPATEGDFAEVRIPRLLRYPVPEGAQRVRLGICEYVQETTGKVELFRFQSLEAAE